MLRWTSAGAVSAPTTVQIRAEPGASGSPRAGAPAPGRALTPHELLDNLHHFTEGLRTPRTQPCTALVLSGAAVSRRPDLPAALAQAAAWGLTRVTLHAAPDDTRESLAPLLGALHRVVVPVEDSAGVAAMPVPAAQAAVLVPLARLAPGAEASLAAALARVHPAGVTLSLPFPVEAQAPPPLGPVRAALDVLLPPLVAAGVDVAVKGLPACFLGPWAARAHRTPNRWYVDDAHQRAAALLFTPGVISWQKDDHCRFCAADGRCDGVFSAWSRQPGRPPTRPLDADLRPIDG